MKHHWRLTGRSPTERENYRTSDGFNFRPIPPSFTTHFQCATCGIHNNTAHEWTDGAWTIVHALYTSVTCDPIGNRVSEYTFDESPWEKEGMQ